LTLSSSTASSSLSSRRHYIHLLYAAKVSPRGGMKDSFAAAEPSFCHVTFFSGNRGSQEPP
jgi:hypothetical protein